MYILTLRSERRTTTTTGDVTTEFRITTTHSSNSPSSHTARPPLKASLLRPKQVPQPGAQLTHMPFMVATRTISRCGTHRSLNNSSKEAHRLARPVPRLHIFRDHALDAETAAQFRHCLMLACLHECCLECFTWHDCTRLPGFLLDLF